MLIFNINTRDDSLEIESSEIKHQSSLLVNRAEMDVLNWGCSLSCCRYMWIISIYCMNVFVVDVVFIFLCCDAFIPKGQSRILSGTRFSLSFFFFFFFFSLKVVHHIHGWRVGKLQTCFSKDTGCRNQSTLTMTCECLANVISWSANNQTLWDLVKKYTLFSNHSAVKREQIFILNSITQTRVRSGHLVYW